MNDTTTTHTRTDSYPYSAISIYALHPMYISLPDLGELADPEKGGLFCPETGRVERTGCRRLRTDGSI